MSPTTDTPVADAPVADVLLRIVERRRRRLAEASGPRPAIPADAPDVLTAESNPFLAALRAARRGRAVIAEVKLGSPRLGSLAGRFDPAELARVYAGHGAAALSVVVEPDFFHGSYEVLAAARRSSGLPAIAKDFVVDERQLVWARDAGADAVLLIAALYTAPELRAWARKARALGLAPLVETHDAADVDKLAGAPWELVGVNNRDLRTFAVDLQHSIELLPRLPPPAVKVAESGLRSAAEVERLRQAGFDAFLVGESLLTAADPAAKLRELVG